MNRRILCVDDNEIIGWTLTVMLWVAECEVRHVQSATEAFEALAERSFDLVLLDLEMPGLNGLEALSIMKRTGLGGGVPVVLLTSSDELVDIRQAKALGARGYLTKGYAHTALVKCVDRLLSSPDVTWLDDFHCVTDPDKRVAATPDTVIMPPRLCAPPALRQFTHGVGGC